MAGLNHNTNGLSTFLGPMGKRISELEDHTNQLQALAHHLNYTKEKERRDIARFLQDQVGQLLDLCVIKLDQLKNSAQDEDLLLEEMNELKEVLLEANNHIRELTHELKPPPLYEKEDLVGLLQWLGQKLKKYDINVTVESDDTAPKPVSEEAHTILYECVRELCLNIIKHAGVGEATITVKRANRQLQIVVQDTGRGFNIQDEKTAGPQNGEFGLFNIQERMEMLGGDFTITSRPGQGTTAIVSAPLQDGPGSR